MLTVVLVYILARVGKTVPTTNLLLAGVSISSFCTALTSYLMIQSQSELRRAIIWLLGGSSMSGWEPVLAMLPYTIIGLGALLVSGNPLNVLQFGEEQASQLGLNVQKARVIVIIGVVAGCSIGSRIHGDHRIRWFDRTAPGQDRMEQGLPPVDPAFDH